MFCWFYKEIKYCIRRVEIRGMKFNLRFEKMDDFVLFCKRKIFFKRKN